MVAGGGYRGAEEHGRERRQTNGTGGATAAGAGSEARGRRWEGGGATPDGEGVGPGSEAWGSEGGREMGRDGFKCC